MARKQAYYLDLVKILGERGGDDLDRAREVMQQAVELGGAGDRLAATREWLAEKSGDPEELLAALDARAADLMARFGPAGPPAQFTRPIGLLAARTERRPTRSARSVRVRCACAGRWSR